MSWWHFCLLPSELLQPYIALGELEHGGSVSVLTHVRDGELMKRSGQVRWGLLTSWEGFLRGWGPRTRKKVNTEGKKTLSWVTFQKLSKTAFKEGSRCYCHASSSERMQFASISQFDFRAVSKTSTLSLQRKPLNAPFYPDTSRVLPVCRTNTCLHAADVFGEKRDETGEANWDKVRPPASAILLDEDTCCR